MDGLSPLLAARALVQEMCSRAKINFTEEHKKLWTNCKDWAAAAFGFTNDHVASWLRRAGAAQWSPELHRLEETAVKKLKRAEKKSQEASAKVHEISALRYAAAEKLKVAEEEAQRLLRVNKDMAQVHASEQQQSQVLPVCLLLYGLLGLH